MHVAVQVGHQWQMSVTNHLPLFRLPNTPPRCKGCMLMVMGPVVTLSIHCSSCFNLFVFFTAWVAAYVLCSAPLSRLALFSLNLSLSSIPLPCCLHMRRCTSWTYLTCCSS